MRKYIGSLFGIMLIGTVLATTVPTANAASYSWVYNQRGSTVKMHYLPGSSGGVRLKNNTRFVMKCWLDVRWNYTGNYSSRRWFYGQSWSSGYGYVHSSYVYYQKTVRRC